MAKTATAAKPVEATLENKTSPTTGKKLEEPKRKNVIVTVKAGAISKDVGPAVLAGLDKSYKDEAKANQLIEEVKSKRYDLLSSMTLAIVKAAKADDTINLDASFSGEAKKMNVLNDQLGLALGFREVVKGKDSAGNEVAKITYAKEVTKYFPTAKDDKKAPETIRKATLRSNFLHMLKKCAQAAAAIVEKDLTVTQDKASGTLQISGPAVTKAFGSDTVLLNEKQTVGEGENSVKLKEKPSFTALAKMGAEAAGKVLQPRVDSRVGGAVDTDTALPSLCNSLVAAINKVQGTPDAKTIEAFKAVQSAMAKYLK
ncbi:MAG TPA: hypothetical protein VIY48_13530 [Candidatus Paceibacterota bacterium]